MDTQYRPAECFPLGEYIAEELEAREWSLRDLAERMGGVGQEIDVNHLTLEMLIYLPDDPRLLVGDETFGRLAKALDVDEGVLRRLDAAWRTWNATKHTTTKDER